MVLLLLIFAHLVLLVSSSNDCPELFWRYSKIHTYCKQSNAACNILRSSVDTTDIHVILDEHNRLRDAVAAGGVKASSGVLPSASYMMQLVWDDELAAVAQKHADQCTFEHDCSNCRRVQNFGVGQNLAIQVVSGSPSVPSPNWPSAIKSWYDEIEFFNENLIDPFVMDSSYGHFSQLMWADTWRVGCGYVCYTEGKLFKQLYTCNYGPNGNVLNKSLYKKGVPCSACPVNSCCGQTCGNVMEYPGLCKLTDEQGPNFQQPSESEGIFYCDFHNQADCNHYITGKNQWKIYNTLSGNYLGIILDGGEESTVVFKNSIKPISEIFCFVLKYRKGANVDGEENANKAVETLTITSQNYQLEQELPNFDGDAKHQFSQYSMTLSWKMETEFQITFSVPPGKPQQFLEIQSISATDGKC